MKKSKIVAFALGTALLTAFLFFGTAAVAPEEACAGNCEFDWSTAYNWGMGINCQAAHDNCYSHAYSEAQSLCAGLGKGLCQVGTFTESACYWSSGAWKRDCTLDYKCDAGEEFPF